MKETLIKIFEREGKRCKWWESSIIEARAEIPEPANRQAGLKIGRLSNKEGVACCHEFGYKELTRD